MWIKSYLIGGQNLNEKEYIINIIVTKILRYAFIYDFEIINRHKIIAMFSKSIAKFLITLTPSIFIIQNLMITNTYNIVKQCLIIILTSLITFI